MSGCFSSRSVDAAQLFDRMPPLESSKKARVATGRDSINALPDSVLEHILGFLRADEAVRTMSFCGYIFSSFFFERDLKQCPTFSKLKTLLLNDHWCVPPDFLSLRCILEHSPVLEKLTLELFLQECYECEHKEEIIGRYHSTDRSSAISEHLKEIKIKCQVVGNRTLQVLKFLSTLKICTDTEWYSSATMPGGGRKTACVTGGNGYIASALIKMLLEKGYAVKTTVRNPNDTEKNSHLKELQALGLLEVLGADLDEEGSFDDAVAGCHFAFLIAAPVNLHAKDPEKELIEPAVRGTLNVLRSCVKAKTVKRVILTSSAAAVSSRPLQGDGHVLDESSWADVEWLTSVKPGPWAYPISKVLLEKEACKFAEEHGMSLVTVCPVLTVGAAPARKIHTSVPASLSLLSGDEAAFGMLKGVELSTGGVPMVHVADLCRAEMFVAEEAAAAGRYICCGVNTTVSEIARVLGDKYPEYDVKTNMLSGELLEKPRVCLSSAKLIGEGFEFKYKTLDEIYGDVVEYGKALGILPN
ncbi:hypothetical protein PR202_ga18931 [Eleusine coracana subsp. coracana]|uniref:NAD-dependent epimerase/dehydratase domain-containing protein n=1 Tax=Eleusine coracana subsp. coracana TaxID=191504 RepID=A0AAV5CU41_ELECO|nr:hypothetical protein PR202_ga18931 [Eleusine coracana subsp. coracana]